MREEHVRRRKISACVLLTVAILVLRYCHWQLFLVLLVALNSGVVSTNSAHDDALCPPPPLPRPWVL